MRSLARNRQPFAYAHALDPEEVLDEYGHHTGSYRQKWSEQIESGANISPDKGVVGVEAFGAEGDRFDPNIHNAVMMVESDERAEGEIVSVFQKGYKKGDKIIRYAMVTVAN